MSERQNFVLLRDLQHDVAPAFPDASRNTYKASPEGFPEVIIRENYDNHSVNELRENCLVYTALQESGVAVTHFAVVPKQETPPSSSVADTDSYDKEKGIIIA